MKPNRTALSVFILWLLVFLLSFLAPRWTEATGDGFTRGWNRVGVWMQWQLAAVLVACFSTYFAFTKLKTDKPWKRLALVPIATEGLLAAAIVGLVVYLNVGKPSSDSSNNPPPNAPTKPVTAEPDFRDRSLRPPPGTQVRVYSGFYRSGFESSDFYGAEIGGPWWLEASGHEWETLQSFLVEREGRGSSVTVALEFNGWTESSADAPSGLGDFEGAIKVVSLNSIRPVSPEEFDRAVASLRGR